MKLQGRPDFTTDKRNENTLCIDIFIDLVNGKCVDFPQYSDHQVRRK